MSTTDTTDTTPHTDHGPVVALGMSGALLVGIAILVWVFTAPADGSMTPTAGYVTGAAVAALARLIYLVFRGRR
jgi:hypothetical protein